MKNLYITSLSSLAVATILSGAPAPSLAQSAPPQIQTTSQTEEEPGSVLIVTGTRRADRTVAESSAPIDVFDEKTLATMPSGDMNTILKTLVPSFSVGRFSSGDGSVFVRPPTLRGLPPDETLVLVNGKRRHRSALVQLGGGSLASGAQGPDLAQIPAIAIQSIEVLRDGAAAQYGSDAIAGVMNFTLKNRKGYEVMTRIGQNYEGDGENVQIAANAGFALGNDGYFTISGEYINGKQAIRSVQRPDALYMQEELGISVRQPTVQIAGNPRIEAARFFANGAIPLGSDELYFFGNYGVSDQSDDFNYRRPVSISVGGQNFGLSWQPVYLDTTGATYNGSPVYDGSGRTFQLGDRYPGGYTPRFKNHMTDLSAVVGYRGEMDNGLKYDLSASYGQSRIQYSMTESINPSMGPDSPSSFKPGTLEQRETNLNADFSYPLEVGLHSPLYISAGGEFRREGYIIGQGDMASWTQGPYLAQYVQFAGEATPRLITHASGSDGFPGYGPSVVTDEARKSWAVYLDLETDITEGWSLATAARYEKFTDFGDTINFKASTRYAISPAIAIRGTASTGFRAPTPGQLFTKSIATTFAGTTPIARATLPVSDPAAQFYGATALSPEKSVNFSGGFVLTPTPNFTVTADYYHIKVKDRIGISSYFTVTAAERPILEELGVNDWENLGQVQYFTNAFDTKTQGFDIVANHNFGSGIGIFNTILALNYNKTRVTKRDITVINDERKGDLERLNPKWRITLTENFSSGPFNFIVRGLYYGKFTDYDSVANGGNMTFGDEIQIDAEASYMINQNITLSIGAENILDNYPDKEKRLINTYSNSPQTGQLWPDASPLSYTGGFYYMRLGVKF